MRILQMSDTHLGITTDGQIKQMLRRASAETFDIIVHCGDWCGGTEGHKKVKATLQLIRKYLPDTIILSVIGNHDYWCTSSKRKRTVSPHTGLVRYVAGPPGSEDFYSNLTKIEEHFREHKVHFLDKAGPYVHPDFDKYLFVGTSGWYNNSNPPTNDARWLPIGLDGDTHRFLLKEANKRLFDIFDKIDDFNSDQTTMVFISHFPVIKVESDRLFEQFSWSASLGDYIKDTYKCRYFLNGHAHQLHKGPLRYECGSDYYSPKYQIIEI